MIEKILDGNVDLPQGDAVVASRLGGAPLMELYHVGEHVTSLEVAGFPISLLKLDDEMKRYPKVLCDVAAGWSF